MVAIKPTLIIEDCSALGNISMTAAATAIESLGGYAVSLPSVLLSTQTEGFGVPTRLDTAEWMVDTNAHWSRENIDFSGSVVGYLGREEIIAAVAKILDSRSYSLVVVDPVMADLGKLYPGFDDDYPQQMLQLCRSADVITPNWTELCLLAGMPVEEPTTDRYFAAVAVLRESGVNCQVVVTGIPDGERIACWLADGDDVKVVSTKRLPGHFYGTGDLFAALLYGFLQKGQSLHTAVQSATEALSVAVEETSGGDDADRKFGMRLFELIKCLTRGDAQ
ncbi:MAG: PfkB family carbohydrate kinase [Limosilactobacillus sp.]|uniref:PfkB family carbohydrate kinase n=1 Tax=Limosilactobacillus sp. TaxID=2773925 RepID=UPI00270B977D|nr:PfkB family carbohydrate kinase [Limosilactobacillus sp.]